MKSFKRYLGEAIETPYTKYIESFYQAVKDTHNVLLVGNLKVFTPKTGYPGYEPGKLITSGVQGDEPAGPVALLKWVRTNPMPPNLYFIPICSPESYVNKTHFDDAGRNVNLEIPNNPSVEIHHLVHASNNLLPVMCAEGYLSCQEDPKRDVAYLLVWKNHEVLVRKMLDILGKDFQLMDGDGVNIGGTINDNTTLGAYCVELGASFGLTIETPVENATLAKRVNAQIQLISEFVKV